MSPVLVSKFKPFIRDLAGGFFPAGYRKKRLIGQLATPHSLNTVLPFTSVFVIL